MEGVLWYALRRPSNFTTYDDATYQQLGACTIPVILSKKTKIVGREGGIGQPPSAASPLSPDKQSNRGTGAEVTQGFSKFR